MNNVIADTADMTPEQLVFQKSFLGWQCRIRQQSVRQGDGRPTPGMVPTVFLENKQELSQVVALINKVEPEQATALFRTMIRKTFDPLERWESAIKYFETSYYDDPGTFSNQLTALFGPESSVCDKLIAAQRCILNFEQNNQRYQFECEVISLKVDDLAYQATYWHNSLFNPVIPSGARVLGFLPDWSTAKANPPVY